MFEDIWNPTHAEIEAWAFVVDPCFPEQDWDLAVTRSENAALIIRLAADIACPIRYFFLHCLYLFVGDAFRSRFRAYKKEEVDGLLSLVQEDSPGYMRRWRDRTKDLLAGAAKYRHARWCGGRYARREEDENAH